MKWKDRGILARFRRGNETKARNTEKKDADCVKGKEET